MDLDDLSKTTTKENNMDKYKEKFTINKWFSFINLKELSLPAKKSIQAFDSYVNKLTFERALKLFLFAINDKTESLRHLDKQLVKPQLKQSIGLNDISYSQLSRALKDIDEAVLLEIFNQLLSLVYYQTANPQEKKHYIIDSTTFSLSKGSYPWAKYRKTKSGVKLHLKVCFMENGMVHPEQFEVSNAVEHDSKHLEVFLNQSKATYVFDRGYLDLDRFSDMDKEGYYFVTRPRKDTTAQMEIEFDTSDFPNVESDQKVIMGKNKKAKHTFRLVTIRRKGRSDLRLITNRYDLTPDEIGEMYRSRWQIELFFKHIKQHMTIKKYFSKSQEGVTNQIYMAMIAYLLMLLVKLELELKQTVFQILRVFRSVQFESYDYFIELFEPG